MRRSYEIHRRGITFSASRPTFLCRSKEKLIFSAVFLNIMFYFFAVHQCNFKLGSFIVILDALLAIEVFFLFRSPQLCEVGIVNLTEFKINS